jgi:hypothetical protein
MFYKIQKNEHEGANFFSTKMTEIENLGIFGLTLTNTINHIEYLKYIDRYIIKSCLFKLSTRRNQTSKNS